MLLGKRLEGSDRGRVVCSSRVSGGGLSGGVFQVFFNGVDAGHQGINTGVEALLERGGVF